MINIAAVLDCEKSVKWFERAAEQGDAETQFKLGNFYLLVKTASGISILTRLYVLLFDLFDYSRVGLIN